MSETYHRFEVLSFSPVQIVEIFNMLVDVYSLNIGFVSSIPFDPNTWTVSLNFKQDSLMYSKKLGPYLIKTKDPASSQLSLLCSYLSVKENSFEVLPQALHEFVLTSYPNVLTNANSFFDYSLLIKDSLSPKDESYYRKHIVGIMDVQNINNIASLSVNNGSKSEVSLPQYFVPKPPAIGRDVFCCLNEIVQFNNKLRMHFAEFIPKPNSPDYGGGFGVELYMTVEGKNHWSSPKFVGIASTKRAARSIACQQAFEHYLSNLSLYGITR